jgi:translocation and assembly module TamB
MMRAGVRLWLSLLLLGFACSGLVAWSLFSSAALELAARLLTAYSASALQIEGTRGRLVGPFSVERWQITSGGDRYTLHDIEVDWAPLALLDRRLEIHRLKIARIVLVQAASAATKPPVNLHLPLAVDVKTLQIDHIEIDTADAAQPVARDLQATFTSDGGMHRLDALSVELHAGTLSGHGTLAAHAPFAVQAEAHLAKTGTPAINVAARANGDLDAIAIDFDSQVTGHAESAKHQAPHFSITGTANLRPFAPQLLTALRMKARDLDPHDFLATAPRARLALDVDLATQGDGALAGRLQASNAAPRPLDRDGLPFASAEARLVLHWNTSPRRLKLDGLLIKVGSDVATALQGGRAKNALLAVADGGTAHGRVDLVWPDDTVVPHGDTDLTLAQLDPAALHSALRPGRLSGRLILRGDGDGQQATLALPDGPLRVVAELARRGNTLTLARLQLEKGRAKLSGTGALELDAARSWHVTGQLHHFDPATFIDAPHPELNAELNAKFDASGHLLPYLDGHLRFALDESRLKDQALAGNGDLTFTKLDQPARLLIANGMAHLSGYLNLALDKSRLAVKGGWGNSDSGTEKLELSLNIPDITRHRALFPSLPPDLTGALDLTLTGTAGQHHIAATADLPGGRRLKLSMAGLLRLAANSWRDATWQGHIESLSLAGDLPLALLAPTPLRLNRTQITLGAAELSVSGGRVALAESSWQPGRISSRGRFDDIALRLGEATDQASPPPTRARGDWALNLQDKQSSPNVGQVLTGHLRANVSDLRGLGPAIDGNLTSAGAIEIDAEVAGTLAAPVLSGHVRGTGLAIGLIDENVQLREGELTIRFDRERAIVERLSFVAPQRPPASAMRSVNTAGFTAPKEPGRVNVSGDIDLKPGQRQVRLVATLSQVPLMQRAERWVIASGTVRLDQSRQGTRAALKINADLVADAGFMAEASSGQPKLADDIVVLGRQSVVRRSSRIDTQIVFDLGQHFHLRAAGLAARLSGRLHVRGGGDRPLAATGSIATHDATFEAYGQRLTVERGIVNFQGPLDDPGLNVLALRKDLTTGNSNSVEAGVEVSGTAQRPVVRLVSTPAVSDTEKLSWIVLGRAPDSAGSDSQLLIAAAGAILGKQGAGIAGQLAQNFGIDELSFRQTPGGEALAGQTLVLGKRLSARTYLAYEQGLTAATGAIKLTYALTPRISVVTHAGDDNAIDVFYHFTFD